ncbi:MAG: M6 family metalloprotease domain-containing protein [Gemmatimonadales bacterium]
MRWLRSFVLVCTAPVLLIAAPTSAVAQDRLHPRWEIPGFDFRRDGVWRARSRRVAELRRELQAQGRMDQLNAPMAFGVQAPATTAVTGTVFVPAVLLSYQGVDSLQFMRDTAQYRGQLFGSPAPVGSPYTLRTFYEELSNGLLSMQGQVMGWVRLDGSEATYTGTPGTCIGNPFGTANCNGLFSSDAIRRMQDGFRQSLARVDTGVAGVDFGQFDNDGPDLIPNSPDDDGYVDMIMFAHATQDGACGGASNNHIWSHRFVLVNATQTNFQDYVTNDPRSGGGLIRISDYFASSALGGASSCDPTQIMAIGTAAHEFGHGLGLPDLYDTSGPTEGIGRWGLMGAGNYSSAMSPARMEAWSLDRLGWITLRQLTTGGTYAVGPVPTADTAFLIQPLAANPRNEYFLVENRQATLADTALIRNACQVWYQQASPPPCDGGLLAWHIDGTRVANGGASNTVNSGPIHGVALEEADGARDLWCPGAVPLECNRGDAGDPYPGITGNTMFSFTTNPAALTNFDSSFVGFAIDSIRQLVPNGALDFRLRFGALTLVQASDTTVPILVDGAPYNVFRDLFDDGSSHTIAVTDSQLSGSGRTRFTFQSWSDGGAISHQVTGSVAGASYTATLAQAHLLNVTVNANGSVSYSPAADSSGTFVPQGTPVTLTATPTPPFVFGGWTGDTTASNPVLTLPMGRPFNLVARFDPQLIIASGDPRPGGLMGKPYADTLRSTGGTGTYTWQVVSGALPSGLTLAANGRITGIPAQTGSSTFTVSVTSGAQQLQQQFGLTITAPMLATAAVVTRLLTGFGALSVDDLKYLDLLGNQNNSFDVGDFLAWVQATGATPAPPVIMTGKGDRP